jgi:beta-glucosidase
VQLYVSNPTNAQAPIRALKGFQRIFLKAGESRIVNFTLTPEELSIMDDTGHPKPFTGKVLLSVGGSQPDATTVKNKKTVQAFLNL